MDSFLSIFADDTKLFAEVGTEKQVREVQESVDAMQKWATTWKMKFNSSKCHVLHLGHNNKKNTYMLGGLKIEPSHHEKDVGVYVQDDLKFDLQCKKVSSTCNRIIGQVWRSFTNKDPELMLKILKCYIFPHTDYCVSLWNPYLQKDIDMIESIQRRFTRMITGMKSLSYEDRLDRLGLCTLKERRRRIDLIETYKIWNNIDLVEGSMFRKVCDSHSLSTRNASKDNFVLNKSKLNHRKHFFSNRVIQDWNKLPVEVQRSSTLGMFKSKLSALTLKS